MCPLLEFTFKDLFHDWWRSLLTITSLAVIITGYLVLATLAQILQGLGKQPGATNNLVVLSASTIDPMDSTLGESTLDALTNIAPGQIQEVFPVIFRHLKIEGSIMQVRAAPLENLTSSMGLQLTQGGWPQGDNSIAVDANMAKTLGWRIGSIVNIYGTEFKIDGMVQAKNENSNSIWMEFTRGERLFGKERGFQVAYLVLGSAENPEQIQAALQSNESIAGKYDVYLENSLDDGLRQTVHNLITFSRLLSIISLLAVTFGIYNFSVLSFTERQREIRLLQILGFLPGKLLGFLFTRMTVLIICAFGLGSILCKAIFHYYFSLQPIGLPELSVPWDLASSTILLGMGLAILFGLLGVILSTGMITTLVDRQDSALI